LAFATGSFQESLQVHDGAPMSNNGFSETQRLYLEGLASGLRAQFKVGTGSSPALAPAQPAASERGTLELARRAAEERLLKAGQRPCAEERAKTELEPDEMWGQMLRRAKAGEFPRGPDVFRYKFHGLFYGAPADDAFM